MKLRQLSVLALAAASAASPLVAALGEDVHSLPFESVIASRQELDFAAQNRMRDHYNAGRLDSALVALRDWRETSGANPLKNRIRILLNIAAETPTTELYDRYTIVDIIAERNYLQRSRVSYSRYGYESGVKSVLRPLAGRIAREVLPQTEEGSVERLLCKCYAGDCDSIFVRLKRPEYRGTMLRSYYEQEVHEALEERIDVNWAFYTGAWIPQGDNEVLGHHPVLGAVLGGSHAGYIFNLLSEVRLLDSDEEYPLESNGVPDTTKSFVGYYVGLELGRELYHSFRHEVFATGGFGLDGFAYAHPEDGKPKRKVSVFNANVGLGYKFHLHRFSFWYIGVQTLYNFMDYAREAGDALGGNAVSVRFLVGFSGDENTNSRLRDLDY